MRTNKEIELLAWQWVSDNDILEAQVDVFQAFFWGVKTGQSHWIASSDFLPPTGETVLTYDQMGDFYSLGFINSKGTWAYDERGNIPDPSHWHRLPEKPKEKDES